MSSATFWATHQVGGPYKTLEESQEALARRQARYPTLLELMPVEHPGKTVLDFGCGPGHDTILFCEFGAGHVFYYDISPLALEIVDARLELHGLADHASPASRPLPKVDYIHCAGVLHHAEYPSVLLRDLRHALKPGGEIRVMIYDGDRSKHTQSKVPITRWWTEEEFSYMAEICGLRAHQVGHYECSAKWRKECYAACYRLTCFR